MRDKIGRRSPIDSLTSQVGAGFRYHDLGGASMMVFLSLLLLVERKTAAQWCNSCCCLIRDQVVAQFYWTTRCGYGLSFWRRTLQISRPTWIVSHEWKALCYYFC